MIDFEKLSQAELVKFARLLDEQVSAYDEGKLELYEPHPGQKLFHEKPHKIRLLISGNRYGKSECSVMEAIWLCLGNHPYHPRKVPVKGILYVESFGKASQVIEPKLEHWLHSKYLTSKKPYMRDNHQNLVQVNFANGSTLRIGTYDQTLKKAESSDWDFVGFDEPPSRDLYVANLRGTVDRGGLL